MKYSVIHSLVVYQYSSHDIIQNLRNTKNNPKFTIKSTFENVNPFFETLTEIIHFLKLKTKVLFLSPKYDNLEIMN